MEKFLVRSKNIMTESNIPLTVYYWLCEKEIVEEGNHLVKTYGVCLEKHQNGVILEMEHIPFIAFQKNCALEFIKKLASYDVTPATVLEITDEFISTQESAYNPSCCFAG